MSSFRSRRTGYERSGTGLCLFTVGRSDQATLSQPVDSCPSESSRQPTQNHRLVCALSHIPVTSTFWLAVIDSLGQPPLSKQVYSSLVGNQTVRLPPGDEVNLIVRSNNCRRPIVNRGNHYDNAPMPCHSTRPDRRAAQSWSLPVTPSGMAFDTVDVWTYSDGP